MEVRRARQVDAVALGKGMKVVADEDRWLARDSRSTEKELIEMYRGTLEGRGGDVIFVLEEGEDVVGSLGLHPTNASGVLELGMWVLPQWRGKGGGRMLLDSAIAEADASGVHKVELEVFPDNAVAIAMYALADFEIEGLRRRHYRRPDGSLRSALIMARHFGETR